MSNDTDEILVQDELTTLKARADLLGVSYHPSIGLEKLREKVNAAAEGKKPAPEVATPVAAKAVETANQVRARLKRAALELVRIRVTCMNPAKAEWEGEIITAGNAAVGSVTKFVPFNVEDGWHVPRIIYTQLVERQCQIFTTTTDSRGNKTRKGKLIREFAIEVLPPLTAEELRDLAQRQAMANAID
jgi:hypothetical protein